MSKAFAAPEVMEAKMTKEPYNPFKVDIYQIGAITYNMLCGVSPFDGLDDEELEIAILSGNIIFDASVQISEDGKTRNIVSNYFS